MNYANIYAAENHTILLYIICIQEKIKTLQIDATGYLEDNEQTTDASWKEIEGFRSQQRIQLKSLDAALEPLSLLRSFIWFVATLYQNTNGLLETQTSVLRDTRQQHKPNNL